MVPRCPFIRILSLAGQFVGGGRREQRVGEAVEHVHLRARRHPGHSPCRAAAPGGQERRRRRQVRALRGVERRRAAAGLRVHGRHHRHLRRGPREAPAPARGPLHAGEVPRLLPAGLPRSLLGIGRRQRPHVRRGGEELGGRHVGARELGAERGREPGRRRHRHGFQRQDGEAVGSRHEGRRADDEQPRGSGLERGLSASRRRRRSRRPPRQRLRRQDHLSLRLFMSTPRKGSSFPPPPMESCVDFVVHCIGSHFFFVKNSSSLEPMEDYIISSLHGPFFLKNSSLEAILFLFFVNFIS